jgi:uncharacterized protein (DUF2141 family)
VVFGSVDLPWGYLVPEGTAFQVILYAEGTPMDIATSFETAPRAVEVNGQFPVTGGLYDTVNYQAAEVPAGTYTAFAWVDVDGDGTLDPWTDMFGWHSPAGSFDVQPAANVVVADAGLADVDFMLFQYNPE